MVDHIYDLSYISPMKISPDTLFASLANEIRLRCLVLMRVEGELCVCELIHALNLSQPMISRHLALLRSSGLVSDRRAGQWVYYSINPELDDWVINILQSTAFASGELSPFIEDLQTLKEMVNRPGSACCA